MIINKEHILTHFKEHLEVLREERDKQRAFGSNLINTINIESVKYIINLIKKDLEETKNK